MTHSFYRYRIHFRKLGDLRWIGHHDLVRTVERLFRRLELPMRMSQGFHPKPKIRFVAALALGIESDVEWVEVELLSPADPQQLTQRMNEQAPPGLEFVRAEQVTGKMPQLATATYELMIPPHAREQVAQAVSQLQGQPQWRLNRPHDDAAVDIQSGVLELVFEENRLCFQVAAGRQGSVRPREVLRVLGIESLETQGAVLRRIGLTFVPANEKTEPQEPSAGECTSDSESRTAGADVHPEVLRSLDENRS